MSGRDRSSLVALASALCLSGVALAAQAVFRTDVHSVPIYATVRGSDGHLVVGLNRNDFRVIEDGHQTAITEFSADEQPISVVVLVDAGLGIRMTRGTQVARAFVNALREGDVATIGSFGGLRAAVTLRLTDDRSRLLDAVNNEIWPVATAGRPWDGLNRALAAVAGRPGRRVVLMLSSGEATARPIDTVPIFDRLAADGALVYSVFFEGTMADRWMKAAKCPAGATCAGSQGLVARGDPSSELQRVVDASGGALFWFRDADDAMSVGRQISAELHQQYLLAVAPLKLDGKRHKLEVQAVPSGLTVQSRRTYIAEAQ